MPHIPPRGDTWGIYDRDFCTRDELSSKYLEFTLKELGENPHLLNFITDPANSRAEKERRVSMEVGRLIGDLHEALRGQHLDPDSAESALNPETRRNGGMYCTSPENIHKVIDPLFLDDLRAEFDQIRSAKDLTEKKHMQNLSEFRDKIGSLRFFDPACGSGDLLTKTYLCLRQMEDDALNDLNDGQMQI